MPTQIPGHGTPSDLVAVLCSGSALGANLASQFQSEFGPCLYNLYGSSETGFASLATPQDLLEAPGTVGYPPRGTTVRILDANDQNLGADRVGRVFLKTDLTVDYLDGGHRSIVEGYLDTGDLGHRDSAGRLHIDGRADDMILSGGENVFPGEVEDLLATHPAVVEVAVIGVPDDEFGQRLRAFVVLEHAVSDEELREFVKARLARYKVPRDIVRVECLPRNALGKVLRRKLPS